MSLFAELRKRRVFATAAIYVPAAWLAAEILMAIFDRFESPDWAGDVVVVLFLLGFPVALLLSWLFDVTADGVKRASAGTPVGIVALLASGLFLSIGAYVSYQVFSGRLDEVRIAILPFSTNQLNEAAAPYGAGVAADIRSALRNLPKFRVPAQTSSEAVLRQGLDIPGIAKRLGVQYVLEGTLDLVGDRLEVDVVLLDEGGQELWSERYEHAVRDLFSLQNDLVMAVSTELGLKTSNSNLQAMITEPPPTNDPEAHRLFLQGRYLAYEFDKPAKERSRMQALMAARLRDPGYAAVYATIALDYANECWLLDDRNSPLCDTAINFAQEGLELDPELGDAWVVLAMVRALRYDWEGAQEAVDHFYSLPSPDIVSTALPTVYFILGRLQNAWDAAMEYHRNDPLSAEANHFARAWAYMLLEDRDLFDHYDALTRQLAPEWATGPWPDIALHKVSMDQAIEDARQSYGVFGDNVDWAPVIVPVVYGEAEPESAWPVLDQWLAEGQVKPAQYWWMLAYVNRIDDFIDLAFELFDAQTLNPPWMLLSVPNHEAIRTHPRFLELLQYIGYAGFWDQVGWPRFCPLIEGKHVCDGRPAAVKQG